jgi:hypothetical protein
MWEIRGLSTRGQGSDGKCELSLYRVDDPRREALHEVLLRSWLKDDGRTRVELPRHWVDNVVELVVEALDELPLPVGVVRLADVEALLWRDAAGVEHMIDPGEVVVML